MPLINSSIVSKIKIKLKTNSFNTIKYLNVLMDIPTEIKLPSSMGGFILIFHAILLLWLVFFNYNPTSFIFSFAISGIIIGMFIYYYIEPHLKYKYQKGLWDDVSGRMKESLGYSFAALILYLLLGGIIRTLIIKALGLP